MKGMKTFNSTNNLINRKENFQKSSQRMNKRVSCLYTNQIMKKRKTWNDGFLKININESGKFCTLTSQSNIVLETKQLETHESDAILSKQSIEIVFENYLVQLDEYGENNDSNDKILSSLQPPLKLTKFVPPSRYIPPIQPTSNFNQSLGRNTLNSVSGTQANKTDKGLSSSYKITDDELDDLWGNDDSHKLFKQSKLSEEFGHEAKNTKKEEKFYQSSSVDYRNNKSTCSEKISQEALNDSFDNRNTESSCEEKISLDIDQSIWFS